jgi:hypothetical protein
MEQRSPETERRPLPRSLYIPTCIKGIGTGFFGQRAFRPDGTFLTTEFSVMGHLPILPIRSIRVRCLGQRCNRDELGLGPGPLYGIYEETNPNWIQVAYVYTYMVFVVWWLFFFGKHFDSFTKNMDEKLGALTIIVGFIWPFFIPRLMRFMSRRLKSH